MSKKVFVINQMAAYALPSNFKDCIQFFQDQLDSVSDEFKDKVTIDIETVDNWGGNSTEISVYYYRPFTNEELEEENRSKLKPRKPA